MKKQVKPNRYGRVPITVTIPEKMYKKIMKRAKKEKSFISHKVSDLIQLGLDNE